MVFQKPGPQCSPATITFHPVSSRIHAMTTRYDSRDLEVLTGLDPVRRRPGMYTDTTAPDHLAQEVIDNSVDEALAGHARNLAVTIHSDGSLSVADDGRGMPIDLHPELGRSGVEVIFTVLHAGSKFSEKIYQFSGGLHGVGVSVVNALSQRLEVWVRRGGGEYHMAFKGGVPERPLTRIASAPRGESGTRIRFWVDPGYFEDPRFSRDILIRGLRAKAVLLPGFTVSLKDELTGESSQWRYEAGLGTYLRESLHEHIQIPVPPFVGHFRSERAEATFALGWNADGGGSQVAESYVNLIPTPQGGSHLAGLRTGLLEALREFCDYRNLLPKGVRLAADDVFHSLNYVLSVKLREVEFSGQLKERLNSREATGFVSGVVKDGFSLWLHQSPALGEPIARLIVNHALERMRTETQVARKKPTAGLALPGKLADCAGGDLEETELFLVEGDSAGGSARQARDRLFQAVLPLRGKILNTWESDAPEILQSVEIRDLATALGIEPGSPDLSRLRYGRICILADADSDGAHIATLLCALFVRHFPAIIHNGRLYVAMPPLYRIDVGQAIHCALDEAEKAGILDRLPAEGRREKIQVTRFKGLGEMNPIQLRETTMAPETRRLIRLTVDDVRETEAILDLLLARRRATDRRGWIEDKGRFATVL